MFVNYSTSAGLSQLLLPEIIKNNPTRDYKHRMYGKTKTTTSCLFR